MEALMERTEEIPEKGEEFAESVREKLRLIRLWVVKFEHITNKMKEAVQNIGHGIDRWF